MNDPLSGPKHVWFSATAARQFGTVTYRLEDGREVEVTGAYKTFEAGESGYGWEDKEYVGVGVYVRG